MEELNLETLLTLLQREGNFQRSRNLVSMWETMGKGAEASSAWGSLVVLEGFISMCKH